MLYEVLIIVIIIIVSWTEGIQNIYSFSRFVRIRVLNLIRISIDVTVQFNSSCSELAVDYTKLSNLCLTFNQNYYYLYIGSKSWLG